MPAQNYIFGAMAAFGVAYLWEKPLAGSGLGGLGMLPLVAGSAGLAAYMVGGSEGVGGGLVAVVVGYLLQKQKTDAEVAVNAQNTALLSKAQQECTAQFTPPNQSWLPCVQDKLKPYGITY